MPLQKKISKEEIIETSYHIAREKGIEGISARLLAKKLHCSVQPIFFNFANMEELKEAVLERIITHYHKRMRKGMLEVPKGTTPYKGLGLAYIRFAKEEPVLFRTILMNQTRLPAEEFMTSDQEIFSQAVIQGSNSLGISKEEMRKIHLHVWIYTHGIASLIATNTCHISLEEASTMLTEVVSSLITNQKGSKNGKNN